MAKRARKKSPLNKQERELWKRYLRQRADAPRNLLVEHYMPLVHRAANKMRARVNGQAEMSDLVSWGVLGIMQAIASFDLQQQVKFSTYAAGRINGAMLDGLREVDHMSRLGRSRNKSAEVARVVASNRLGRHATDEDTADQLGMSDADFVTQLRESLAVGQRSLSEPAGMETDSGRKLEHSHVVVSREDHPARSSQKRDLLALVTTGCSKDERLILILYYYEELTMREIGQTLGLSESRVSQMHSALLIRLRERLAGRTCEFTEPGRNQS